MGRPARKQPAPAKHLPKVEPAPLPFKPLPPRKPANRQQLSPGDSRKAWDACEVCGADRIEELVAVLSDGGRDWVLHPCFECEEKARTK